MDGKRTVSLLFKSGKYIKKKVLKGITKAVRFVLAIKLRALVERIHIASKTKIYSKFKQHSFSKESYPKL